MGFRRSLIALLLLTLLAMTASGAENLLEKVRWHYSQEMRAVDDLTMTHRYLAEDDYGELIVVDQVDEWMQGNKWRRERSWIAPTGERQVYAGDYSQGTRSTVICDGIDTWVIHESARGTDVMPLSEALRDDPSGRMIDYTPPLEPWLRDLPPYGYAAGDDRLFGRSCIIADCEYARDKGRPRDGGVRIHTVWIDRDDYSVLRMRGYLYWYPESHRPYPDSVEIQIDNTTFETVTAGYLSASLPTETVVTIDGVDDQYTSYWYNTGLRHELFRVDQLVVIHDTIIYDSPIIITGPPPGPPGPHPHPPRPHPLPHPGPDTRSGHREHPKQPPPPKPAPPPPPKTDPKYDPPAPQPKPAPAPPPRSEPQYIPPPPKPAPAPLPRSEPKYEPPPSKPKPQPTKQEAPPPPSKDKTDKDKKAK